MVRKHYKVQFALVPHPKQQEIIDFVDGKFTNMYGEPYRFFNAIIGRQWGKSWLAKYLLLEHAINRKETVLWVAPAISSARTHWNGLVKLIEDSNIPVVKILQAPKEIHFHGGGSISVRSAIEPDNIRGMTVDFMVLDEASFFRDGEYVWYSICLPMVTASGGKVLITTTPNGQNWVYDLFNMGLDPTDEYYKSWRFPSTTSPYQDKKLLAKLKKQMPEKRWREEFEAEFLSDAGSVFSGLDRACVVDLIESPIKGRSSVAGIDIGQSNDNTVFTVFDKHTREQVYGTAFSNIGTVQTVKRIVELLNIWQPEITHIEKNGVGEAMLSLLKETLRGVSVLDKVGEEVEIIGNHKIKPVHMDNRIKREMVERLVADIEYGRCLILNNKSDYGVLQRREMGTYERNRTKTNYDITYSASGTNHDDTIAGSYLAYAGVPKYRTMHKKQATATPKKRTLRKSVNGTRWNRTKNA